MPPILIRPPPGEPRKDEFCCALREYFLVGIVGHSQDKPPPVDIADMVYDWGKKLGDIVLITMPFCPFCGKRIKPEDPCRDPVSGSTI